MPKIEKVNLKDYEHLIKKGKQVVTRRHPRSTFQKDAFNIERSSLELKRFREYYGELVYKHREDWWYIILIGYNQEIGSFMSKVEAERWAELFLGRKY